MGETDATVVQYADVYALDLITLTWSRVDPLVCQSLSKSVGVSPNIYSGTLNCPSARMFAASTYIPQIESSYANTWFIFGGANSTSLFGDAWYILLFF